MKTFEAVFNNDVEGVFAISLVENPAMESLFIALKKEAVQFAEINKEQRILMGLVLEPNKPVQRNQNGEEFNIVFNEQTIKDLSYHFFKQGHQKNSSLEHEAKIQGVTFVESWLVEDSEKDKSANFGFSFPKGSWVATMKVDSDEIWNDYVKTGKVKGFSIDAMLSLKEINLKSNIMSEIKKEQTNFMAELKTLLGIKAKIKLGSAKSVDGDITFEFDGEAPEAGAAIWVMAEDGSKVPVPAGDYEMEGGMIVSVTEEGVIAAVKPKEQEMEQAPSTAGNDVMSQVQEQIKSITIKYTAQDEKIAALEVKLNAVVEENKALKSEVVELSKQPAVVVKKLVTEQVELNKNGRILSKLRQN